jgi:3-oxoacyl-[acyl-carrier-protein] synthase III
MDTAEIRILSAGTAVPGAPVSNSLLARHFGMDELWEQWIDVFVGTKARHLSVDLETGELRSTLADLAERAARHALSAADLPPSDIDLVVMGTATPDALMPTTVNVVADRLGINAIPTYQLQSGCTGAVQALEVARQLMTGGGYRKALVIAGDSCAKHFDVNADLRAMAPAELVNVVVFGDGAGAAVLSADPTPGRVALRTALTRFTGLGRAPGQSVEWYGRAELSSKKAPVSEDYKAIEALVPVLAKETFDELLVALNWKEQDVDYLLPPQLSARMTERITAALGTTAQEITCVTETGNCGNALAMLQLERLLPLLEPGERAIGVAIESSKWIKAGFAVEGV